MKKFFNFLVIIILLTLLFFPGCNADNGKNISSITNSDNNNKTIKDPTIGPATGDEENQEITNIRKISEDNLAPIRVPYSSTISNGANNVEVNKPIEITFDRDIDHNSITPLSFYLKNSSGQVLYSRIILDYRTFTLIPRIPLKPGRDYTAVMEGIKTKEGRLIRTIRISYTNRDLDFGLYWFGKNGMCEKYFPDIENAYYDNEKSTVIYSHGFGAGSTSQTDAYGRKGFKRETFFFKEDHFNGAKEHNGLRFYVNHSWIDAGWNTGILYWDQFADDIDLWGAEAKIWTFNSSRKARYRYFKTNGKGEYREWDRKITFKGRQIETQSISDIFQIYLVDLLKENTSGNIRLVGHSLGNQVVCRLTKKLFENDITVERVALLDPAWTTGSKEYLEDLDGDGENDWVAQRCRKILLDIIEQKRDKFAVEIYHTTGLNLGIPVVDDNVLLTSKICDVNLLPRYYNVAQLHPKHMVVRHHYFWSYASPPPIECTTIDGVCTTTGIGPSASTPTETIVNMMNEEYEWSQIEGQKSPDPSDDIFEKKEKQSGLWGSSL